MSDRTVTIPALGRQGFSLGCLYDLSTNQVDPRKLWNEDQLKDDKLDIQEHGSSTFKIAISNNQEERCKHLDVDASIALEIGAGAVSVEGSAKYVNSSNSNSQVCSVTYSSKKLTKTKKLTMDQLAPDNVTYRTMLQELENATHVVSSITYGKSAHFRFETKVHDKKERDKIAGKLKLAIKAINAEGQGAIERTSEEKKFSEETSCQFFGDYSGIVPPLNLEQAKATIVAIETDKQNPLGVPIEVTLTPLSSLTNAAMKIVASLSAGAVNEAARLLQDIEDIQVLLRTSEKSKTAENYFDFKTCITKIANSYRNRASELKSELCKILPEIKGNGKDEQILMKIIRDYDSSAFSKANTLEWVKRLEAEVLYVDGIIETATGSGIPMASSEHDFRVQQLKAKNGLFYCEAEFFSCLLVGGEEHKGKVSLRRGILDDKASVNNFQKQFSAFRKALSHGGVVEKNAPFQSLLYLRYMGNTNQCDTKFFEEGEDVLQEINTSAKIDEFTLKYDPVIGAITGRIGPFAKEGGHIKLRLCYTEIGGKGTEETKEFDYRAKREGSFQLDMKEHDNLHEGRHYIAKLRFELRPGFVSQWIGFKFRARGELKFASQDALEVMYISKSVTYSQ